MKGHAGVVNLIIAHFTGNLRHARVVAVLSSMHARYSPGRRQHFCGAAHASLQARTKANVAARDGEQLDVRHPLRYHCRARRREQDSDLQKGQPL